MIGEKIWCLDVEASGLHNGSFPIEIGWAAVGEGVSWDSRLVAPHKTWTMDLWSYASQNIHGIDRQETIDDGLSALEVATLLNETFGDHGVLVDAPWYDGMWLDRLYEAAGIPRTYGLVDLEAYVWENMKGFRPDSVERFKWLDIAMRGAKEAIPHNHRAGQDAAGNAYVVELILKTKGPAELHDLLKSDPAHRRMCLLAAGVPADIVGKLG